MNNGQVARRTARTQPDPMKAFKAIAMILNAREEGVKVRLTSVRKVEEGVRKVG